MTTVGSDWTEIEWWGDSTGYGDYQARWRCLARSVQNIQSNSSTVYFKLQKRVTGGSAFNYNSLDFYISGIGAKGDGHSASQSWTFGSVSDTSWTDVGGDTSDMYWSNVRHNDDGTLSLTATATGDRVLSGADFDTDISITLPTIPRATVPAVSPQPLILSGATNPLTVALNRAASSFTHDVTCTIGSYTETKTGLGTSTTFDIPDSVLADFAATDLTKTGTITCITKNGATTIGTKTVNFEARIDATQEHPVIDSITLTDTNPATAAVESPGSFINGASDLQATIAVSVAGSYTRLKKITVSCGGVSQEYTTGVTGETSATITFAYSALNVSGLTVTVEDQRGTKVTESKAWTLINYRPLTSTGTIKRTTNTGSTIDFTLQGDCFGGDFGQQTNTITVTYKYREVGTQAWTTGSSTFTYTPSQGAADYTYTNTISGFLYNKQYDIVFTVADLFSTADTAELRLLQGVPIQSWGPTYTDIYGELHLHDPDDPTTYWSMTPSEDLAAEISGIEDFLAMHNYNWSGSWSNGGSVSRIFEVVGKGLVIINAYVLAGTSSDTGQCTAQINLYNSSNADQGTLSRSGNRVSSSSDHQIAANAATQYYFDGESNINRLRCYLYCTKNGTTNWRIQVTTIGCALIAL